MSAIYAADLARSIETCLSEEIRLTIERRNDSEKRRERELSGRRGMFYGNRETSRVKIHLDSPRFISHVRPDCYSIALFY